MKCKNEKLFALFLSVLLSACSVNQSLNLPNDKKLSNVNKLNTFKTKVEGNIMNFSGTWTTDNNGAFYSIDENVTLNGSWEVKNENPNDNLNTANSNFYESSSSVLYHNTNQVSYLGNGWLNTTFPNTSMQTYYSYNAGNPVSIPYYNTSLAQIKFYNSIYPQGTVYSTSMSGWTFTGSLNSSITTSEIGSKIEIIPNQEFTNFHIVHRKGPNRGSFKVSIYSNLDTLEKEFILNGYNTTNSLSKQEIYGLPKGMHKIVIENLGGTNGNIMDFVDIKIYPSIVASVNGTNFDWYAYVGPNYGKAYLSIDGQGYGYIDLYDANSTIKKVYSIDTLSNQEHTVTIDLTGYKSTSSSGFRVSFATIGNENSVSGSFEGNKIAFNFIKGPDAGILDVFIDNNFVKQINLYSPTKEYYSDLITGLSSGNHTFKISSKREKDLLARGNKIMIDGISEESKLDYSFNGIGIRFKNNLLDNSGMFYIDPINYSYDIFSPFKVENNNQFICLSEKNQYHSLRFVIPLEKSPESKGYLTNFSSIEPIKALLKQKAIFKDGENLYYRDPKAENEIKLVSDQVSEADITPNNNFIFYTKYDDHLYLYNTTSSSLVDLSERYSLQEAYRIYGIDDNWISFTATKDGLEYDVYAYSLAEDKLFNLSGSATKLYDDLSTGISGLIGSKIASPSFVWFNWEGGLRKLYYSNLDTIININDITHIPPDIFPAIIKPYIFKLSYADPKMAFTTQKVAWISKNPEQPYILYVAGLDGSYVSIINVPYIYSPPSGSGLYYVKQDGSLYLFKDGINDILIDRDLSLYISELASDSSGRIVAYTKGGNLYFWDGNTSTQITNSGQVMSLSMAPDGSYITYQENNEVKAYEIATNSTYTLNTNSTNILDIGNNLFDTGECVFYKKIIPKEREIIPRDQGDIGMPKEP